MGVRDAEAEWALVPGRVRRALLHPCYRLLLQRRVYIRQDELSNVIRGIRSNDLFH